MLDLNIIVIMGTIFIMFLISLAVAKRQADNRNLAVSKFFKFIEDTCPFKPTRGGESLLDEYKDSKRVRLIVNGKVLEDLSLAEHEALCGVHGVDPSSPVELRVDLSNPDKPDNILPFPQN